MGNYWGQRRAVATTVCRGRILPREGSQAADEQWNRDGERTGWHWLFVTGKGLGGTGYASAREGEAFERGRIDPHVTSAGGGQHLTHSGLFPSRPLACIRWF